MDEGETETDNGMTGHVTSQFVSRCRTVAVPRAGPVTGSANVHGVSRSPHRAESGPFGGVAGVVSR